MLAVTEQRDGDEHENKDEDDESILQRACKGRIRNNDGFFD